MPIAATGPRLRLEPRSDSRRHSTPAMTVPALAAIGSTHARSARFMASAGCSTWASSSR